MASIEGHSASMGPQLDSCGRAPSDGRDSSYPGLQWGRNLIVAEGVVALVDRAQAGYASMGPQLDSCGRPESAKEAKPTGMLQWGRNLIVAEGHVVPLAPGLRGRFNGAAT